MEISDVTMWKTEAYRQVWPMYRCTYILYEIGAMMDFVVPTQFLIVTSLRLRYGHTQKWKSAHCFISSYPAHKTDGDIWW